MVTKWHVSMVHVLLLQHYRPFWSSSQFIADKTGPSCADNAIHAKTFGYNATSSIASTLGGPLTCTGSTRLGICICCDLATWPRRQ